MAGAARGLACGQPMPVQYPDLIQELQPEKAPWRSKPDRYPSRGDRSDGDLWDKLPQFSEAALRFFKPSQMSVNCKLHVQRRCVAGISAGDEVCEPFGDLQITFEEMGSR